MRILISHLLCDLPGRLVRLAQELFRSVHSLAGNILHKSLLHILAENRAEIVGTYIHRVGHLI